MKIAIKLTMLCLGIGMALLALNGCGLVPQEQTLLITVSPPSGHPPFDISIAAACSQSGGKYSLIIGGQDPIESNGSFTATVDAWPWKARVVWSDGDTVIEEPVIVTLQNERPVAHNLSIFPGSPITGQGEWIDLRYLEQGCGNGMPARISGFEDPDYTADGYSIENDGFTYHIEIYDKETGKQETVYKPDRTVLGPDEYTVYPYFKWFVDWSYWEPPYPFSPMSCVPTPTPIVPIGDATREKRIEVTVKEWGSEYRWVYTVLTAEGSCN